MAVVVAGVAAVLMQTSTVTVPREPVLAGIDSYLLLDWEARADDDNLEAVKARR